MSCACSEQKYSPYPNYYCRTHDILAKGNISNTVGQRLELITIFGKETDALSVMPQLWNYRYPNFFCNLRHANSNALKAVVFSNILLLI